MTAAAIVACIYSLLLWVTYVKVIPAYRAIVGCKHVHGKLVEAVPDRWGKMTALVWECRDCPFQVPLKLDRSGVRNGKKTWREPDV